MAPEGREKFWCPPVSLSIPTMLEKHRNCTVHRGKPRLPDPAKKFHCGINRGCGLLNLSTVHMVEKSLALSDLHRTRFHSHQQRMRTGPARLDKQVNPEPPLQQGNGTATHSTRRQQSIPFCNWDLSYSNVISILSPQNQELQFSKLKACL